MADWSGKTAEEILDDMTRLCREVHESREQPTHVEVPNTPAGRHAARKIKRLNFRQRWRRRFARLTA